MNPFYIPMLVRITIFAALGGFLFGYEECDYDHDHDYDVVNTKRMNAICL